MGGWGASERSDGFAFVSDRESDFGEFGGCSGLECTVTGPALRFNFDTTIVVTGADYGVPRWEPLAMKAGAVLEFGECRGPGARAYILFAGGLKVPSIWEW